MPEVHNPVPQVRKEKADAEAADRRRNRISPSHPSAVLSHPHKSVRREKVTLLPLRVKVLSQAKTVPSGTEVCVA